MSTVHIGNILKSITNYDH